MVLKQSGILVAALFVMMAAFAQAGTYSDMNITAPGSGTHLWINTTITMDGYGVDANNINLTNYHFDTVITYLNGTVWKVQNGSITDMVFNDGQYYVIQSTVYTAPTTPLTVHELEFQNFCNQSYSGILFAMVGILVFITALAMGILLGRNGNVLEAVGSIGIAIFALVMFGLIVASLCS